MTDAEKATDKEVDDKTMSIRHSISPTVRELTDNETYWLLDNSASWREESLHSHFDIMFWGFKIDKI
jgi:hypothetical protein